MVVLTALALAAFPAVAPTPIPLTDDTAAAVAPEQEDGGSALVAPGESACVEDALAATPVAPGGCKACKGRSWCTCSYQGKPRISCNPCCYQGALDPIPICFD